MTGLLLTIMLGPVTMVILRHGLEFNRIAGLWAAAGTWWSDLIFIIITYLMTTSVETWSTQPSNRKLLYVVGGIGLLLMGIWMAQVKKKKEISMPEVKAAGYTKAFFSGFMVNSLSPFTLVFWLGAAAFVHIQTASPYFYYIGLMIALATGDFSKAWLAPQLTRWLRAQYVYWIQVVAGVLIAITGMYILFLSWTEPVL